MEMRSGAVALLFASLAGGCATQLEKAIEEDDYQVMRQQVRNEQAFAQYGAKSNVADDQKDLLEKAHQLLSANYYQDYMLSNAEYPYVEAFDGICQQEMRRPCTEEYRQRVKSASLERQKERAEAESIRKAELIDKVRKQGGIPQTLEEAKLFYKASDGMTLLQSPMLDGGDNNYYYVETYVTDVKGDFIFSWWPDYQYTGGLRQGAVIKPANMPKGIPFGAMITIVGKYTGNMRLPLVDGSAAIVPVFKEAFVF